MNLCLSASGRLVVNNDQFQELAGVMYTLVMSNSVLSIAMLMVISSLEVGSFFDVVDSGLRVKLTEL